MIINDKFKNSKGDTAEVIELLKGGYARIKFLDNYGHEMSVQRDSLKNGVFKNPYRPSVSSVGYFGVGEYAGSNEFGKSNLCYNSWRDMLRRCYEKDRKDTKFYKNVTVCEEWHNFQNFAEWFYKNYPYKIENTKFNLDKDLTQLNSEIKIYSPNTCIWLPQKVNKFLMFRVENLNSGLQTRGNRWSARIVDFDSGKRMYLGSFKNIEEANRVYINNKKIQVEKVKKYLIELNYLSETQILLMDNVIMSVTTY